MFCFFFMYYFFSFLPGAWNEYPLFVSLSVDVSLCGSAVCCGHAWFCLIRLCNSCCVPSLCVCVCASAIGNKGSHNARLTYLNMPFDTAPLLPCPLPHCLPCCSHSPMRKNVWHFCCYCQSLHRRANKLIYYYFTLCWGCCCCCLNFACTTCRMRDMT